MNHATTAAALVLAVEGVAAAVAGIVFVGAAVTGQPSDRGTAVFLGVLLAAFGVALVVLGRGLSRERRWVRTPAYLAQFFGLVVAWYQRSTLPAVAFALGLVCVTAVVTLTRSLRS